MKIVTVGWAVRRSQHLLKLCPPAECPPEWAQSAPPGGLLLRGKDKTFTVFIDKATAEAAAESTVRFAKGHRLNWTSVPHEVVKILTPYVEEDAT